MSKCGGGSSNPLLDGPRMDLLSEHCCLALSATDGIDSMRHLAKGMANRYGHD
jgi:hypothetical protein